jgi:hypothetical protein
MDGVGEVANGKEAFMTVVMFQDVVSTLRDSEPNNIFPGRQKKHNPVGDICLIKIVISEKFLWTGYQET